MDKLLWIDMEMTGLDVRKERIIEVAAIVTNENLQPIAQLSSPVYQEPAVIANMDEWNTNQHSKSGLVSLIPHAPKENAVEQQLCDLVDQHFSTPPVLAGNSISQDRKFIDAYMPNLAKKLHYRLLDVTSWKLVMSTEFKVIHDKKETHRALDDILESIAELQTYINYIKSAKT